MAYRAPSSRKDTPLPTLPEVESPPTVGSAESQGPRRFSNNPYRRGSSLLGPDALLPAERMKAPVRAVFTDLSAAHSKITAGKSSRSASGTDSRGLAQEQDSIPLQDLGPADRSSDYFEHVPLPQLPALTFGESRGRSYSQVPDASSSPAVQSSPFLKQVLPESSSSILHNFKSAIASISSPPVQRQDGSVAARWPKASPSSDGNPKEEKTSLTEGGRNANNLTKPSVKRYSVRPVNNRDLTNLNGSSVYPSSPPVGDALPQPAASHQHTNSSHASESVQYNSTQDRVYSVASSRPAFLDQPYTQPSRKVMHSAKPSEQMSIPDGSTVGNIYNHYLHTDPLEDFSDEDDDDDDEPFGLSLPELKSGPAQGNNTTSTDSSATDQPMPTALSKRLQDRANKYNRHPSSDPPECSLPKLPTFSSRALAPSSTRLGESSSYGDTRELLNLTQPDNLRVKTGLSRSKAQPDLASSMIDSASDKSASPPQARNPFGETPRLTVNGSGESHVVYDDDEFDVSRPAPTRPPLERDISQQLRRASRFSTYSTGSVDDSIINNYRWLGQKNLSTAASRLSRSKVAPESVTEDVRRHSRRHSGDITDQPRGMSAELSSFYAPGAISPSWIQKDHRGTPIGVRIPIIRPVSPRAQKAAKQAKRQATVEDETEEQGDWETVGESGFGTEVSYGYLGGGIKRAGSSVADMTDDGNLPDFDDFESTNRIAQHPAHPQYQSEYRQRDLKGSRVPVFAPVYREHKVNGYLNDSTRTRPQPAASAFVPPPSLDRTVPNPFATPPPQLPMKSAYRGVGVFKSKNPNHFRPLTASTTSLCTEIEEADLEDEPKRYMNEEQRRTWMKEFSKHKLTLSTENEFSKESPTKSRPSSWQQMMDMAADGALIDFNGTFETDSTKSNAASDQNLRPLGSSGKLLADKLAKIKPSGKKDSASKTRTSLSAIPSGARYRGLDGAAHDKAQKDARRAAYRQSSSEQAKKYPTNKLRPLTLVESLPSSHRPGPSSAANSHRAPQGTLRRQSWRALYSPNQLLDIEQAEADRMANIPETQSQSTFFSTDNTQNGGDNRFLFETPTLRQWKREISYVDEKTRCSIAVLCFSILFPPFLLLYVLGTLDPIITWWTDGRFVTYAKRQRRLALILLIIWCFVIVAGLIAFITYWFSNLRGR